MAVIALGKPLKPTFSMLYNPSAQIAREPHIKHTATIGNQVDIEHLFNISTHRSKNYLLFHTHYTQNPVISPKTPVISTEGGALAAAAEKSAVVFAVVCFLSPPTKRHFDRRRRICRRSGEICCRQCHAQHHFVSGSGSTVLIPGRIVDVALNFR